MSTDDTPPDGWPERFIPKGSFSCGTCGGDVVIYVPIDGVGDGVLHSEDDGCACDDPQPPAFLAEVFGVHADTPIAALNAAREVVKQQRAAERAKRKAKKRRR